MLDWLIVSYKNRIFTRQILPLLIECLSEIFRRKFSDAGDSDSFYSANLPVRFCRKKSLKTDSKISESHLKILKIGLF